MVQKAGDSMPDYETLYPGRFLKKEMLEAPRLIRIVSVNKSELENDKGQSEEKVTVKYKWVGGDGEIVWCKTNAHLAAVALGSRDIAQWAGKLLVIYHEPKVRFGGKNVGGVRILGSPTMTEPKEVMIKMPRSKRREYYLMVPTDKKGIPLPTFPAPGMELSPHDQAPAPGGVDVDEAFAAAEQDADVPL